MCTSLKYNLFLSLHHLSPWPIRWANIAVASICIYKVANTCICKHTYKCTQTHSHIHRLANEDSYSIEHTPLPKLSSLNIIQSFYAWRHKYTSPVRFLPTQKKQLTISCGSYSTFEKFKGTFAVDYSDLARRNFLTSCLHLFFVKDPKSSMEQ